MRQAAAALLLALAPAAASPATESPRQAAAGLTADAELDRQWDALADVLVPDRTSRRNAGTRDVAHLLLETAAAGGRPERVAALLAAIRSYQDTASGSQTRGNFVWYAADGAVTDPNAVEFIAQLLCVLHVEHAGKLSPENRAALEAVMRDALDGIHAHKVKAGYTNICLMKAWNLMAIGERLGGPEAAAAGYALFGEWLDFTARNGVSEFGAVTYYGTDLDSLALIAKFAGRQWAREAARDALRYFWTDIAANWWAPGRRLGCANSRSYDYLYGRGALDEHLRAAGWLAQTARGSGSRARAAFRAACTFAPEPGWTGKITGAVPRVVVQRWGAKPEQTATHHISANVSIATSARGGGGDSLPFVANLAGSAAKKPVPQIILFMDGRGDPYGANRTRPVPGAHPKALHLTPLTASVQRGADALQLLDFNPAEKRHLSRDAISCLLTHVTVPTAATLLVNGVPTAPGTPGKPVRLPADATFAIRLGQAAVAFRFPLVSRRADGGAPEIHFIRDNPKGASGRVTIVHDSGPPKSRATVAFRARAIEFGNDGELAAALGDFAAAAFSAEERGGALTVRSAGPRGDLVITTRPSRNRIEALSGGEPRPALLSVNGVEVGAPILGKYSREGGGR
jgi:hypothetical protein